MKPGPIDWDRDALELRAFATDDRDRTRSDAERLRDQFSQLAVSGALDGRRLQADKQGPVADAGDAGRAGAGNDANRELNHANEGLFNPRSTHDVADHEMPKRSWPMAVALTRRARSLPRGRT